ncbi:MAG TPA: DMT family protein [Burkholderiales bacterium]|nr:DMT family protein [Burkholderiales bacterium]
MLTIGLLVLSNLFMTVAWYGHLRFREAPLYQAVLVSWAIAFFEYCLMVPANRLGYGQFTAYQLKMIQEVVTLVVFAIFAMVWLGEPPRWNYAVAFVLLLAAVGFAFLPSGARG